MFSLFDKAEISWLEVESIQGRTHTGDTSGTESAPAHTHRVRQTELSASAMHVYILLPARGKRIVGLFPEFVDRA